MAIEILAKKFSCKEDKGLFDSTRFMTSVESGRRLLIFQIRSTVVPDSRCSTCRQLAHDVVESYHLVSVLLRPSVDPAQAAFVDQGFLVP